MAATSSNQISGPYTLIHLQTGGVAPVQMSTSIDSAAAKISLSTATAGASSAALTAEELTQLTAAIESAGYKQFTSIKGGALSDAYSYKITLKVGDLQCVTSWTDGAKVSATLSSLNALIMKLRNSKISAPDA